jgi:hypothetical protein
MILKLAEAVPKPTGFWNKPGFLFVLWVPLPGESYLARIGLSEALSKLTEF